MVFFGVAAGSGNPIAEGDVRLEQVIQPSGRSSFFKSHQQTAAQDADELRNRGRFGFEDGLQDHLPAESIERPCQYTLLAHKGALFSRW